MNITLCWTGKTQPDYLKKGIDLYVKRIQHFTNLEIRECKETKGIEEPSKIIMREEKEFRTLLYKIKPSATILLDERGKTFNSLSFAKWLEKKQLSVSSSICFIIGGAYGFSDLFKNESDELISLSQLTYSHQMARLIFVEQLYRAYCIINNLPYHHE